MVYKPYLNIHKLLRTSYKFLKRSHYCGNKECRINMIAIISCKGVVETSRYTVVLGQIID